MLDNYYVCNESPIALRFLFLALIGALFRTQLHSSWLLAAIPKLETIEFRSWRKVSEAGKEGKKR